MTTPYTDDDVKAVQGTAICGPTQARRLLDAGYRKVAPEGFKGLCHRAATAEHERDEARAEVERLQQTVEHWKNEAEYTQERISNLVDHEQEVDVYPVRPTVTADMVREVWEVLLPRLIAGSYSDAADALNRLLAEQGGRRMRYRLYGTPGAEEMYFALADAYEAQVEPYIDEPDLRPRQIEEWTVQDPRSFLVDAGTLVLVRTWEVTWDAGGNPLADGTPIYGPGAGGKEEAGDAR